MSNTITIELCTEDRARVDRLIAALERKTCDKCVSDVVKYVSNQLHPAEPDPVQKALAETLDKATKAQESPENSPGEAEAPTLPTTPEAEEKPKAEENTQPATEKTVDQKDIRALYVKLSASGKKKEAQAIILPYATAITAIPDDKCSEVYEKLIALEG
jgi:hypothetical protein